MAEIVDWYDITGVSIVVLEETEQWLRDRPDAIRSALLAFSAAVGATAWRGPRADRFVGFLDDIVAGSLAELEVACAAAADLLREQADQQRTASAPPGAGSP